MRLNKSGGVGSKAWNLLRASLLWARKGSMFRRCMEMDLRVVPRFIKSLGHHHRCRRSRGRDSGTIWYGERELSFEETPTFNIKMPRPGSMHFHLPHIPCINPSVDFDFDFDDDHSREESLNSREAGDDSSGGGIDNVSSEEESIDTRAEEFIAKFYQQMMLQRQLSYLRYKERQERGAC